MALPFITLGPVELNTFVLAAALTTGAAAGRLTGTLAFAAGFCKWEGLLLFAAAPVLAVLLVLATAGCELGAVAGERRRLNTGIPLP